MISDSLKKKIEVELKKNFSSELTKFLIKKHIKSLIAYAKLIIIAKVLNEGWKPNYNDSNEEKWYPFFVVRGGFRFHGTNYYCDRASAGVGARLCFKTKTLAEYAGKTYIDEYRDFMCLEEK